MSLSSRKGRKDVATVDFWISYSDLMAGLMMVFVLLLMGTLLVLHSEAEENKRQLKDQQEKAQEQQYRADEQRRRAELQRRELEGLRSKVSAVLGVRAELLARVRERFARSGSNIEFDDATGAVRLGSDILFGEGSSTLTDAGQDALRSTLPLYLEALLGDPELGRYVDRISIEGHTNSNYSGSSDPARAYLYNLRLSQGRAYAALDFIIREDMGSPFNPRELLVANGYSSSRLIHRPTSGAEDKTRSRRIEIRFRLKDEETLRVLDELIKRGVKPTPDSPSPPIIP